MAAIVDHSYTTVGRVAVERNSGCFLLDTLCHAQQWTNRVTQFAELSIIQANTILRRAGVLQSAGCSLGRELSHEDVFGFKFASLMQITGDDE